MTENVVQLSMLTAPVNAETDAAMSRPVNAEAQMLIATKMIISILIRRNGDHQELMVNVVQLSRLTAQEKVADNAVMLRQANAEALMLIARIMTMSISNRQNGDPHETTDNVVQLPKPTVPEKLTANAAIPRQVNADLQMLIATTMAMLISNRSNGAHHEMMENVAPLSTPTAPAKAIDDAVMSILASAEDQMQIAREMIMSISNPSNGDLLEKMENAARL